MAGRIRDADIVQVREAMPIDRVVGDYLQLRPAGGGSLKGLCPFHDERSPSFQVTPTRGLYYCFGCGKGGDTITFVREVEHLDFTGAVELLARKAGITLTYEGAGSASQGHRGQRDRLVGANTEAQRWMAEQLVALDEGRTGRDFLRDRGFDRTAAERFGVGYAPRGWDVMVSHLIGQGFTRDELTTGGLASQTSRGTIIDRFRGRLVWPIRDLAGDIVGFGARKLHEDDTAAKYLNTPETPLFKKGRLLYGLDLAKAEVVRQRQAVVVEGYTDVMACHLAGIPTAVATCGTSFGEDHVGVLRRLLFDENDLHGELIFTFDGDAAGQKAALRAGELDPRFALRTYVAVARDGLDPCDLRLAHGDQAVRDLVGTRRPLFEFVLRAELAKYSLDSDEARLAALDGCIAVLARIRDDQLRAQYVDRVAGWLGFTDAAPVRQRMPSRGRTTATPARPATPPGQRPTAPAGVGPGVERDSLKLALQHPTAAAQAGYDSLEAEWWTVPAHADVHLAVLVAGGTATAGADDMAWVSRVLDCATDDVVRSLVTALAVEPLLTAGSAADPVAHASSLVRRVEELDVDRRLRALKARMQRQDETDDPEALFRDLMALEERRRQLRG